MVRNRQTGVITNADRVCLFVFSSIHNVILDTSNTLDPVR